MQVLDVWYSEKWDLVHKTICEFRSLFGHSQPPTPPPRKKKKKGEDALVAGRKFNSTCMQHREVGERGHQ